MSLMFVTLLLAAGTLALEREENVVPLGSCAGWCRGRPCSLEKIGLAAACSLVVSLVMLLGLALFVGLDLQLTSRSGRRASPPGRSRSR